MKALRNIPLARTLMRASGADIRGDVLAGLTVAVMLVPQAMAYALLAGLDPIVGLYASTVPLAIYALFGSSRVLAVGPVAMVSLLVASAIGSLGVTEPTDAMALAAVLALAVGAIQLGLGLIRLGFLVRFLSHPVLVGFTSAAALIIGASQLKHLLGIDIARSQHVHSTVLAAAESIGESNLAAIAIAAASIAVLVVLKRLAPRFPRFLLVVAGATAAVWALGLDVSTVGSVPGGLPSPTLPSLSGVQIGELLPLAAAIALVAFMESIAVAQAFARKSGDDVDANQELRALGLANLAAGLFRSYPVTGGFSRTAVNEQAGAGSGLASLTTAAVVAVSLLFLTPLFFYLPKAVLAAIIITAVIGLVDVAEVRHLWRVSKADAGIAATTFIATLSLGIELGIAVGVAASLLVFVGATARPHIAVLGRLGGSQTFRNLARNPDAEREPGVLIIRIDAPLFFANTVFLKEALAELEQAEPDPISAIVIDASAIGSVDSSGAHALLELVDVYRRRGIEVVLAAVRGPVRDRLRSADDAGLLDDRIAVDVDAAVSTRCFNVGTNESQLQVRSMS